MKTGIANLPLHWGKAPRYLFHRMEKLAREITTVIIQEYGPGEMLKRLSNPYWFQAFGCVIGYDWHSSGVTTTVCGALKSGLKEAQNDLGFFVAGGKGGTSRKTPSEIQYIGENFNLGKDPEKLVYASRMSAKIDSAAIQDGYQLYHHNFFFTKTGEWAVIQQGMNFENRYARRYHWHSAKLRSFVDKQENVICDNKKYDSVLNLTSPKSNKTKDVITDFAKYNPEMIAKEYKKILKLNMPRREWVTANDIRPENLKKVLIKTYEKQPKNFEQILGISGIGPKSVRALTLIAEIAFGTKADWKDPVKFSFAHGGKDGYPYPIDKETYDKSIHTLRDAIQKAKLNNKEKTNALLKLL